MRECGNRGWGGVRSSEAVESEQLEGEMYHRCAMATWWSTPHLRSGWSRIEDAMRSLRPASDQQCHCWSTEWSLLSALRPPSGVFLLEPGWDGFTHASAHLICAHACSPSAGDPHSRLCRALRDTSSVGSVVHAAACSDEPPSHAGMTAACGGAVQWWLR